MDPVTVAGATGLAAIALAGSWLDIRYRRLPNWLCAGALAGGIAFGLAQDGWIEVQTALLHCLIALVIGIGLFAIGAIGAGDAKFYAGLAAWFPLREAPLLIGIVSLAGLVLLVCWLLWRRGRRRRPRSPFDQGSDVFDKLPYGVAIAAGAVIAFAFTQ